MAFAQPFPLNAPGAIQPKPQTFEPDLNVRLICPDCRVQIPNIIEDFRSGDLVCGGCGLVLGARIVDTRSEWRTFANDEGDDPSRVGAATDPLWDGMEQLDTAIGFRDGGSGEARKLQRAAARGKASQSERNLMQAFGEISSWCNQISLPKTISDIAKQLYKRSYEENLLRRKNLDAVIGACIFIACRQAHVPRTFGEISRLTHVSKTTLGQCYKALEQVFNLSPGAHDRNSSASLSRATGAEDMLVRFCNHLDLPHHFQAICGDVIKLARDQSIGDGRSPVSVAGGAIYFTSHLLGQPKSAKEISQVAGVSESTIKKMYRIYLGCKERLVKKKWVESGKAKVENLPDE